MADVRALELAALKRESIQVTGVLNTTIFDVKERNRGGKASEEANNNKFNSSTSLKNALNAELIDAETKLRFSNDGPWGRATFLNSRGSEMDVTTHGVGQAGVTRHVKGLWD